MLIRALPILLVLLFAVPAAAQTKGDPGPPAGEAAKKTVGDLRQALKVVRDHLEMIERLHEVHVTREAQQDFAGYEKWALEKQAEEIKVNAELRELRPMVDAMGKVLAKRKAAAAEKEEAGLDWVLTADLEAQLKALDKQLTALKAKQRDAQDIRYQRYCQDHPETRMCRKTDGVLHYQAIHPILFALALSVRQEYGGMNPDFMAEYTREVRRFHERASDPAVGKGVAAMESRLAGAGSGTSSADESLLRDLGREAQPVRAKLEPLDHQGRIVGVTFSKQWGRTLTQLEKKLRTTLEVLAGPRTDASEAGRSPAAEGGTDPKTDAGSAGENEFADRLAGKREVHMDESGKIRNARRKIRACTDETVKPKLRKLLARPLEGWTAKAASIRAKKEKVPEMAAYGKDTAYFFHAARRYVQAGQGREVLVTYTNERGDIQNVIALIERAHSTTFGKTKTVRGMLDENSLEPHRYGEWLALKGPLDGGASRSLIKLRTGTLLTVSAVAPTGAADIEAFIESLPLEHMRTFADSCF